MRHFQLLLAFLLISALVRAQNTFSESITKQELKEHLYYLASDKMEGRNTGEPGQKIAAEYISREFRKSGLIPVNTTSDSLYYQRFKYDRIHFTENVLGYIPAETESPDWVVITAHYDHIGKSGDRIFNGADDNASGTSALLEIAEACSEAKKSGAVFNKNILFIAFSAEELGLIGSKYFVYSDMTDTMNIILNINMDMIGRSVRYGLIETFKEQGNPKFKEDTSYREDYVYLFRKGKHTGRFTKFTKKSARLRKFKIDQSPGLLLKSIYKTSSDHKHFIDKGIPVMVFFTGLHPDYHTERDTPDKIDYENLSIITQIIFESLFNISIM